MCPGVFPGFSDPSSESHSAIVYRWHNVDAPTGLDSRPRPPPTPCRRTLVVSLVAAGRLARRPMNGLPLEVQNGDRTVILAICTMEHGSGDVKNKSEIFRGGEKNRGVGGTPRRSGRDWLPGEPAQAFSAGSADSAGCSASACSCRACLRLSFSRPLSSMLITLTGTASPTLTTSLTFST